MPRSVSTTWISAAVLGALLGLAGFGLTGCGGASTTQPAQPPPRLQKPRSQASPKPGPLQPPELVAPPPAYGNKIVLAKGTGHIAL